MLSRRRIYRLGDFMFRLAGILLALLPATVQASPVYLKCLLDPAGQGRAGSRDLSTEPMDVALNEEAGSVTYSFPWIDRSFTVRGAFTADKVTFNGFTVDRTDLAFTRDMSDLQAPGRAAIVDRGKCTLVQVKRAF
jgi:hypothetical protein